MFWLWMYNLLVKMFAKAPCFWHQSLLKSMFDLLYISVQDIPEPPSRPDDSEYQEFRNFLAVTESGRHEQHEEQVCYSCSTFCFCPRRCVMFGLDIVTFLKTNNHQSEVFLNCVNPARPSC